MKNTSLFQIILLAVFAALGVSGVLIFAFAVSKPQGTINIGKVVIWGTFDAQKFSPVLEIAAQNNSDLQGVSYEQKNEATYEQQLSDALSQKTGPDIFVLRSDYAIKNEAKVTSIPYEQFNQVVFENLYVDAANVFLGPNGVSAFPFAIDPLVLYWNRDTLATYGYAQPPRYWEDVLEMATKITERNPSGEINKSTIALGTYQNIDSAKAILNALLLQKGMSITTRKPTGQIAPSIATENQSSRARPAVEALTFYTQFADPSQSFYSWNGAKQSSRAAFAAGEVALYVGFASEATLITSMNPNMNFGIADMPQFKDAPQAINYARVYAFAVPKTSDNQGGARLAAQLLDSATTTGLFAKYLNISSARRDVLSVQTPGYGALFNKMAIISRSWADPDPVQTNNLFRAMIEGTVSGAATPPQAVQYADRQMAEIIGK